MERSILIDTHCHLDDPAFDPDREEVLARARMAGVEILILPGVEPEGIPRALALAERHPGLYVAVGIHPHVASQFSSQLLAQLRSWARHPRVVAIGEIGLDFYRDRSPREAQREAFRAQLELAGELGLPVIIHQREAREAVMEELERWLAARPGARGVLHAFSGDPAMARIAVKWGFLLGIGGPLTYPRAESLREAVRAVGLDGLVLETDAPYLPPQPHRGRRNEPAYLRNVAEALAQLLGLPMEQIARQTTANACRLFRLPPPQESDLPESRCGGGDP
ncbi:TatD family hydrolase [Thermoflexus hugenholtzii]|uniref:TatD DNase family protein n=1 Tax=Thermoflexus hugenholtzii JAD2 TaxID=877466 RepID=A0A212RC94_9CHLR|nr:TatD family hydrolase [Thermoflexus hugenholtzii]SNB69675.1 TatD DNase family protein [Thermoflexus hugenholtzii JAD2]